MQTVMSSLFMICHQSLRAAACPESKQYLCNPKAIYDNFLKTR